MITSKEVGINDSLKEYSTSAAVGAWDGKDWVCQLHGWCERLSSAFELEITTPAILIDTFRARRAAYCPQNGFGIRHEIGFNRKHLAEPLAFILVDLLGELLHEWQAPHGTPSRSRPYNRELRRKARVLGVDFDFRGRVRAVVPGPFTALLAAHNVDPAVLADPGNQRDPGPGHSKLKKWACRCTNVRAAVELHARCELCGQRFVRVEVRSNGRTHGLN